MKLKLSFILLFLFISVLGAGVAWLWLNPPPKPIIEAGAPAALPLSDVDQYLAELDPIKHTNKKIAYKSIKERPLFIDSRRKPKPYVPPPPKPKPKPAAQPQPKPQKKEPPPNFKLVAIVQKVNKKNVLEGNRYALKDIAHYKAYLNHNGHVIKVQPGDEVDGWRISSIRMDRMTLIKGPEIIHLNLRNYGDAPAAQKAGQMQLLAINQINGRPYAYISGTSEGTVKLKQGQKIDGWEIITIDSDAVKLRKEKEEKNLYLWQYEARSSAPAPRAQPRKPKRQAAKPPRPPRPAAPPRRN